jgi:hypothetical protein
MAVYSIFDWVNVRIPNEEISRLTPQTMRQTLVRKVDKSIGVGYSADAAHSITISPSIVEDEPLFLKEP